MFTITLLRKVIAHFSRQETYISLSPNKAKRLNRSRSGNENEDWGQAIVMDRQRDAFSMLKRSNKALLYGYNPPVPYVTQRRFQPQSQPHRQAQIRVLSMSRKQST